MAERTDHSILYIRLLVGITGQTDRYIVGGHYIRRDANENDPIDVTEINRVPTRILGLVADYQTILSTQYSIYQVDVTRLDGGYSIQTPFATPFAGLAASAAMLPTSALNLVKSRFDGTTRNGRLGIVGVPADQVDESGFYTPNATYESQMATFTAELQASIYLGAGATDPPEMGLCILGKVGVTPGSHFVNFINDIQPANLVGTRVTRKTGRGQ